MPRSAGTWSDKAAVNSRLHRRHSRRARPGQHVSVRGKPNGRPAERSQLRLSAASAQVSRPASVTCVVSDKWSAKILNQRGLSVTPCHAGEDAPPGRPRRPARHGQQPSAGLRPWQSPGFSPPTCRLRQLAHERSHYAQYRSDRLCPVVADGLRQIPIGAPDTNGNPECDDRCRR